MHERSVELLILDFAGVCTPTALEKTTHDAGAPIPIRPGVESLVADAQRRGVTVLILSNEISTTWRLSCDLFTQVDRVISCADNKIYKPDRRAFQRCLLLTGIAADRTLLVDDDGDNIAVAASLGMQTIRFDTSAPDESLTATTLALR